MGGIATILLTLLAALIAGCGSPSATQSPAPTPAPSVPALETLRLEPTLAGMKFDSPTNLVQAPGGEVLVTEQDGRIWEFAEGALRQENTLYAEFLDIRDRVSDRGWEEGLLGLALDPADRRYVYVYYSAANPRRSVVSRFSLAPSGSPTPADPDSELIILEVAQPYANHNGGQLAFGPDGYLYVGLGDGGSPAGDPQGNGQDTATLLGAILRIDVSAATAGRPYTPSRRTNPFAAAGGRPEIWAYGLRNPWRFSFDRGTGELWAGDVGQNRWEEIDVIEGGRQLRLERHGGQSLFQAAG